MEKNLSNLKFYTYIYYIHRNFTLNKLLAPVLFSLILLITSWFMNNKVMRSTVLNNK